MEIKQEPMVYVRTDIRRGQGSTMGSATHTVLTHRLSTGEVCTCVWSRMTGLAQMLWKHRTRSLEDALCEHGAAIVVVADEPSGSNPSENTVGEA